MKNTVRPEKDRIKAILAHCWSAESSSRWSEDCPSRGQCGVTALVMHDHFGGEILKTCVQGRWHFYNRIEGARYDMTADQFDPLPEYQDILSNRDEAFADTNQKQYESLSLQFRKYSHTGASR